MSRNQKAFRYLVATVIVTGLVLYFQFRPSSAPDPEAEDHPGVKEVATLVQKKDTSGLAQYVKNDDIVVAKRAVAALGSLGNTDALHETLSDDRPQVRAEAISQLGDRADVSQLPVLSQYLQDPAPEVRIAAMRGVASIRDFSIFDYLVPMLADPNVNVRRGAIAAIEERIGLSFSEFDPNDVGSSQRAIARIRATLPNFKKRFENVNEIEANKKK